MEFTEGHSFGPYRILGVLGEGGMGAVYWLEVWAGEHRESIDPGDERKGNDFLDFMCRDEGPLRLRTGVRELDRPFDQAMYRPITMLEAPAVIVARVIVTPR